jgi:shikimate dehydrogenase
MHNAALQDLGLDFIYVPFSVQPENLEYAVRGIRALDIVGVNVTIPHKREVMAFLDWISDDALRIGSVNTIWNDKGTLRGYSTDGEGLVRALESAGKSAAGSKAVVLGAGGSARAIAYALASRDAEVTVANRTYARAVELADSLNAVGSYAPIRPVALEGLDAEKAIQSADLLVNCTSVGMHPNEDAQPIPSDWLHERLFVYDQIYNPLETQLLRAAKAAGARTANGVGMLVYQGVRGFQLWTGQTPSTSVMEEAVLRGLGNNPPE